MATARRGVAYGAWLLLASSLGAVIVAAIDTFNQGNGIAYSLGVYLVLATTALLLVASLLLGFVAMPRWLRGVIGALTLVDLLGTAFAAYLLEAYWLVALMGVGLIAWLIHVFADPAAGRPTNHAAHREAMTS